MRGRFLSLACGGGASAARARRERQASRARLLRTTAGCGGKRRPRVLDRLTDGRARVERDDDRVPPPGSSRSSGRSHVRPLPARRGVVIDDEQPLVHFVCVHLDVNYFFVTRAECTGAAGLAERVLARRTSSHAWPGVLDDAHACPSSAASVTMSLSVRKHATSRASAHCLCNSAPACRGGRRHQALYPRDAATCSCIGRPDESATIHVAAVHRSFLEAMVTSALHPRGNSVLALGSPRIYANSVPSTKGRVFFPGLRNTHIAIRRARPLGSFPRNGRVADPAVRGEAQRGRSLLTVGRPVADARLECGGAGRVSVASAPSTDLRPRRGARQTHVAISGCGPPVQNVLVVLLFRSGAARRTRRRAWLPVPLTARTPRRLRISVAPPAPSSNGLRSRVQFPVRAQHLALPATRWAPCPAGRRAPTRRWCAPSSSRTPRASVDVRRAPTLAAVDALALAGSPPRPRCASSEPLARALQPDRLDHLHARRARCQK